MLYIIYINIVLFYCACNQCPYMYVRRSVTDGTNSLQALLASVEHLAPAHQPLLTGEPSPTSHLDATRCELQFASEWIQELGLERE